MTPSYIPKRGDYVALSFDPQTGHEQAGRRPALVISQDLFNRHTGLCIVCPITNTRRDYPFHVPVPEGERVTGVVMVEQVKSIDFRSRELKRIGQAPDSLLDATAAILDAILF